MSEHIVHFNWDLPTVAVFLFSITLLGLAKGGLAGIGVLAMPMMLLVMPPGPAAGLILPILMIQDVLSVWIYRGKWSLPNLRLLVPSACLGIALGFSLFALLPTGPMLGVLGTITLAFALRGILGPKAPARVPSRPMGVFLGMMSGLTSTVLHQGGPTFQMYLMPQRLPRDTFVATGVTFFFLINFIKLPGFIWLGQLTREGLMAALIASPLALGATWLGARLVSRIAPERFYTLIYWLLALVGVKLLTDALF
ncbi:sulfite exporter TauE/SafE family protein [Acuticoccus sp. MNP-M23]|uniref:sulfite exporter TauE/SafE family protein n=1 Tax=Acuticoccus sp. MNP-M23 TaxID=3072793 RepID=UPI00281506A4|nr:sulfite exporter TauE/SafE family protein [Acuticoccus sp. MNP-M23]WMS43686.1 sulfite exporter TauE/SafE family protein [Acuticoccus sp. MNP-M23]